ncbi:Alanine--tRNA ligase [Candidatus Hartigia pinicola]|nr:Alanine--tRNA ligase [Candidatus Hartigia pinicola]
MSKSTAEIRQAFLDFFHTKGHQVIKSSSLVSKNDPTLLFTNAGMNQFKDIFLGLDKIVYSRAATAQRCVRAGGKHNDLENVGYTNRHHTFFEMLGNFSFGDYFKHDAINFAWELLTSQKWFSLPKEKLCVTVYKNDNESYEIWNKEIGIPLERIIRIGDKKDVPYISDNFWKMGDTGPCGPCSEIFFDNGDDIYGGPPGSLEENGDRYIEIWNIVFMQFNHQSNGNMTPLPIQSVDTGMGLERIASILQHVKSNYDIDIFHYLIIEINNIIGSNDASNKSLRVIADHIRSCAFLISEGVIPSHEGRGYVLRRIIRRAIRHGYILGAKDSFFHKLVSPLIKVMGSTATDLQDQQVNIETILKKEEEQFSRTLACGLQILDKELTLLKGDTLEGETVFRLYDSYGFPIDLTMEVCHEQNIKIDKKGFDQAMEDQRRRARKSSHFTTDYNTLIKIKECSEFLGYANNKQLATITALYKNGHLVNSLQSGEKGLVILDKTVFYAESGGQVGDTGVLCNDSGRFIVTDTQQYSQAIGHIGQVKSGILFTNHSIVAKINVERREAIRLNHSATHLLHTTLRQVLGGHVSQKSSLVHEQYFRFDFSHFEKITPPQLHKIENIVNAQIRKNMLIKTEIMNLECAKSKGAIALFSEKYAERVRVLIIGSFSIELCGGTHANRTGDIGLFHILSDVGVASGVRRIEAITGAYAIEKIHNQLDQLMTISHLMKGNVSDLAKKVKSMLNKSRELEKEILQLKNQQASQQSILLTSQAKDIKGVKLLVSQLNNTELKNLREIVDKLKSQLHSAVIVLSTVNDEKVSIIVGVTNNLTTKIKACDLISYVAQQIDGNGGGRPDMAQAGGTNVSALPIAMISVEKWVSSKL